MSQDQDETHILDGSAPEAAQGPDPENRAAASAKSRSRSWPDMNYFGNRKARHKKRRLDSKNKKERRSGVMYGIMDYASRFKFGISNCASKGHADRIVGKSTRSDWGFSMATSAPVNLGFCTAQEAKDRLKVYECLPLLGFRHFLVNTKHEVLVYPSEPDSCFTLHTCMTGLLFLLAPGHVQSQYPS